mgnify:CR=1
MKTNSQKIIFLIIGCVLGILIILIPALITGSLYLDYHLMAGLDIADYTLKIVSPMVGLLVIYDTIKTYFK